MYTAIFKPLADKMLALFLLIALLPVITILTLLLAWANRGKPFFVQPRPGLKGKVFKLVKFKTMNDKRNDHGELLPDADRLTPVGSFIRKTSLDELPQFWNVLKGDMSFVGPRPLLVEYLPLYNKEQARRHQVKPGITGWAQVNGRNAIGWDQKFALDVWYVDHQSLALDLRILFLTVAKVIRSEGIQSAQSVTMEKFTGNQ